MTLKEKFMDLLIPCFGFLTSLWGLSFPPYGLNWQNILILLLGVMFALLIGLKVYFWGKQQ